ncbi:MAG: AI-2E family transporter [Ruminococcaceae bacterium]|nr:AI-2E family transporter [Oscillospiraceae bacterium]
MDHKPSARHFLWLCMGFLIVFALVHHDALLLLLTWLTGVLAPLLGGLAVAFVLNLPLRFFEGLWIRRWGGDRRRLRRASCLTLCLLLLAGLLILLCAAVIPRLLETVSELLSRIPDYLALLQKGIQSLSDWLAAHSVPISLPSLNLSGDGLEALLAEYFAEHGHRVLGASLEWLLSTFLLTLDVLLSFVIAIYILAQKERLGGQAKKLLYSLFSEKNAERLLSFFRLCEGTFARFLTGQLTEAVIIGVLCFAGMLLFGMPYPLLISVLVGVTALIPIFGALIGTGIGAFLILMEDPLRALWFVIFIIVLQQVEGNLIYPRVVGRSVGLPGIWVLIAVTVGSSFGIAGMLLGVPIASVLYSTVKQFVQTKTKKRQTSSEDAVKPS